jgi:hypothetical protein
MTKPAAKKPPAWVRIGDARGVAQLATQATTGVTRIVEGVHQSVWSTMGVPGGKIPGTTRGVTGLVYATIRGLTWGVGRTVDAVLAALQRRLESSDHVRTGTPGREALLAVLNGVMGDHLVASGNPFATPMTVRFRGESLEWEDVRCMPEPTGKVLLLIHGLCMNDLQWRSDGRGRVVDHGADLASALGYTPLYLRYNTGLHTSQNGRELSAVLEKLVAEWPTPIEELTVLAHSMGGLVIRSACHDAEGDGLRWRRYLRTIVFLGTPHHGAPLERAGNWVDVVLARTPFIAPFARLGQLRSAGITDLRFGHVLEDDWEGRERFHRHGDNRRVVPLPEGVDCYAIAATTAARRGLLADRLIGDGLVPLHSALGRHRDARRNLAFGDDHRWIAYRMNHTGLLSSPEVGTRILRWLRKDAA